MYFLVGFLLILALSTGLLFRHRKRKACERLRCMTTEEKVCLLQGFIEPFGYSYEASQDIFTTTLEAPQRGFGYTALFDRYAPYFGMVFDCQPVYFDYMERTWLIEFWKGQYGINAGCEVGIYKADGLVATAQRDRALFHSVSNTELFHISLQLFYKEKLLAAICARHWWLTAFLMGRCCNPCGLSMKIVLTFPNRELLCAFTRALDAQYPDEYDVDLHRLQVCLSYRSCSSRTLPFLKRIVCRLVYVRNCILTKLFLWNTRPFTRSLDRLLCLYYCLPRIFRRIFRDRKRTKCCRKSCKRCECRQRRCGRSGCK